jgi:hypothetical protein
MKTKPKTSGPEATDQNASDKQITTERICLKIGEAARVIGVNPATIRRMIKRGLLRPYRGLRTPLIPVKQLQRLVEDQIEPESLPEGCVKKGRGVKPSTSPRSEVQTEATKIRRKEVTCG